MDRTLHRHPFVRSVATGLSARCGVREGDRMLLAVSGGADSIALMHAVAALAGRKEWQLDVQVAHVHHHLRAEAEEDAKFVEDQAGRLQMAFHRRDIEPATSAGNLESNARRLRYQALADVARGIDADFIATAHHAEDQLETLIMRIIRGASVQGLRGIASRRRLPDCPADLIRPMLETDHTAAVEFLREIGCHWREDHTNADTRRWRARLRAEVLPVLRSLRPDAAAKAVQTTDHLHEVAALIRELARRTIQDHVAIGDRAATLPRKVARQLALPVLRSVVRRMCMESGASADSAPARVVDAIVTAANAPPGQEREFHLEGGVRVRVDRENIIWTR